MNILLLKPVPKLGLPGDVKTVKAGYARNYLLPQGLAVAAGDKKAREIRAGLSEARQTALKEQAELTEKAKQWSGKTVTISAKATTDGTLFGSITDRDVAKELGLDRKQVKFQPAKQTGDYDALIDLGQGVDARVSVVIRAQGKGQSK